MTLNITTFGLMTLGMNGFYVTLTIGDTQHNNTANMCQYPQCHITFFIMLSIVMSNVIILTAIMLCVMCHGAPYGASIDVTIIWQ